MVRANRKAGGRPGPTSKPPEDIKPRQVHAEIVSVPARIIESNRSTTHHIIDTLAKTALQISTADNAAEKLNVIQQLWNMQKEAEDRQAEREFAIAKVALAMELPMIPKTKSISFVDKNNVQRDTPYADRADIEKVLSPICERHGISKEYSTDTVDGKSCQVLTVRHVSGHKEIYRSPYMPLDTGPGRNNLQAAGSTSEYGKRYALIGAFNIIGVDKDDDGNSGGEQDTSKSSKFDERVRTEAEKSAPKGNPPLSLPEAAAALETKLRNLPNDKRAECMLKHISIIGAMEAEESLASKAAELRKLCEEQ